MSSEYYSLEKAAEVLGLPTAEINRLRERNELRAFRDGSTWKFRKVDVDNKLAETIKGRNKSDVDDDSDFDLLSMDGDAEEMPTLLADSASFDSLMEDGLSVADDMLEAPAKSEPAGDELSLAPDDFLSGGDELSLAGDDGLSLAKEPASHSDIDLAVDDDELVLDPGGSSGQLDLAGDSGLSLLEVADDAELQPVDTGGSDAVLELDDDDDILALADDDAAPEVTSTIAIPVEDDFQLTPDTGAPAFTDDSESASQVIALEENMFGAPIGDASGLPGVESPFGAMPGMDGAAGGVPNFDVPGGGAFAGGAAPVGEFVSSGPAFTAPLSTEANYSPLLVACLVCAACLLAVPGIMLLDLIVHIWSWKQPFVINSTLMNTLCEMIGLTK